MVRIKWYKPYEVALHNNAEDIWVSLLGKVYDLTQLVQANKGNVLLKPLIENAGTDISHWFDEKTQDIRRHVDAVTECEGPFIPMGRFMHVPPLYPSSGFRNDFYRPWWQDDHFCIGKLSQKTRSLKIVNMFTAQEHVIEVCAEETLNDIQERFLQFNAHAAGYTWKHEGRVLDMNKNLEENDIPDEDDELLELGLSSVEFMPIIDLYFNDDLTEA